MTAEAGDVMFSGFPSGGMSVLHNPVNVISLEFLQNWHKRPRGVKTDLIWWSKVTVHGYCDLIA